MTGNTLYAPIQKFMWLKRTKNKNVANGFEIWLKVWLTHFLSHECKFGYLGGTRWLLVKLGEFLGCQLKLGYSSQTLNKVKLSKNSHIISVFLVILLF